LNASKRKFGKKKQISSNPIPTVDIIVRKGSNKILLERRARPPFEHLQSIPGGHVEYGETVEQAALRELKEETSIKARLVAILGVYSDPKRDPRGQRISTVFIADWISGAPRGSDDAESADWFNESDVPKLNLAFDHEQILNDYLNWKTSAKKATFWSMKKTF
jgi:8-oxo-dGTP diphosphatase